MSEQDNMDQLMQAFNDHSITNDEGQVAETEPAPESSPVEQTTVDKPAVSQPAPQAPEAMETDETPVEDETGKRYVPESRFKEVYGKQKQLERELQALRQQPVTQPASKQKKGEPTTDYKTAALENELLFATLPQFNPEHPEHDDVLDEMAVEIYKANPGITKIQAARKAIERAGKLQKKTLEAKTEARQVKQLQADHGITSRVISRESTKVNPNDMSLEQMEDYLKESGTWDAKDFTK